MRQRGSLAKKKLEGLLKSSKRKGESSSLQSRKKNLSRQRMIKMKAICQKDSSKVGGDAKSLDRKGDRKDIESVSKVEGERKKKENIFREGRDSTSTIISGKKSCSASRRARNWGVDSRKN